jgi:hypothetical protein
VFPYLNAVFWYCKKNGISSYELAKEIGVSQPTAWLFHCKIQQTFESSGKNPLTGEVHIDEFVTGGPEKGKPGRSYGKKKKTLIMVEVRPGSKTGLVYYRKIADFKKDTLYPIIEATVSKDAKVITDEYPSYDKLIERFPKAKQRKSKSRFLRSSLVNWLGLEPRALPINNRDALPIELHQQDCKKNERSIKKKSHFLRSSLVNWLGLEPRALPINNQDALPTQLLQQDCKKMKDQSRKKATSCEAAL